MALGSTQPLKELSTRNISRGVKTPVLGLTILPPTCPNCDEMWEPQTRGNLRACPGLYREGMLYLYLYLHHTQNRAGLAQKV
jgi:hypothetical protein